LVLYELIEEEHKPGQIHYHILKDGSRKDGKRIFRRLITELSKRHPELLQRWNSDISINFEDKNRRTFFHLSLNYVRKFNPYYDLHINLRDDAQEQEVTSILAKWSARKVNKRRGK